MKWNIIIAFLVMYTITAEAVTNKPKKSNDDDNPPKESISRLFNLGKTPKKRGLASIPTYSKGVDIPIVRHSILKPFILDYPMKSVQIGVKIPMKPLVQHHPPTGHGIVHHLKPSHVHHAVIKPGWPVNCAPNNPPAPTVVKTEVALPPQHVVPASTFHVAPAVIPVPPPALTPVLPIAQPPIPFVAKPLIKPVVPVHTPFIAQAPIVPAVHAIGPAFIKPGKSVQSSVFATFPRHPFINNVPVAPVLPAPAVHQPIVPLVHKVPVNVFPTHHHISVGHVPTGVAHHAFGIAHHPIGVGIAKVPVHLHGHTPLTSANVPLGFGHIPLGAGHVPVSAGHVPLGGGHIPVGAGYIPTGGGHVPVGFGHPLDAGNIPLGVDQGHQTVAGGDNHLPGVLPTSQIPIGPDNVGNQFGQVDTTTANSPGENIPFGVGGHFPNDNIPFGVGPAPTNIPFGVGPAPTNVPLGVGPAPTNVPPGVGDFPLDQNPFLPRPDVDPTVIPTSNTGLVQGVPDEGGNVNGIHNIGTIDTNPWIPMSPSPTLPSPTPPQFIPESETNFAPTDHTNFNQGYHYQPQSNIPFEEINEQYRSSEQVGSHENIQEQGYRNHFSIRQHLPLRRPSSNFAGFS